MSDTQEPSDVGAAILLGGLAAGTLDIGAAVLISGRDPVFILQFIASGLLGQASFAGGLATAGAGLLLQWAMSLVIAAIFTAAALRMRRLRRHWLAAGLAYGLAIFVVMNFVVVPFSAVGRFPHFSPKAFALNLTAMGVFGLIVSAAARNRLGR